MFRFLKQELEVVTTDGFRLSMLSFPQVKNQVESERLLIPIKAFLEVCRIAEQTEAEQVELQVSQELKQVKFQIKQTEVYVRLIDGDYPPYEKIIPDSYKISLALEADKIKQELQRAHILAKQTSNIVRLKIADGAIDIRASSPSFGEYQGQVLIDDKEVEAEIAFNANYLLDFLSGTKPEKITFNMNESLKPAMFAVDDVEDFIYVVMPFRVNE
jgi:DNA polymerase-3 subunit beta